MNKYFFFSGHVWDGQEYFGMHFFFRVFMCREMDILRSEYITLI